MTFFEKYVLPFLISCVTFITPAVYWMTAIGFFIMADLGLRLLICLRKNEPIVSSKLWKTIYKMGVSMIFILVAFACEYMFAPDIPFTKIVGSFMILVEIKSIDEKAYEITGYSLFSLIIDKLTPKK